MTDAQKVAFNDMLEEFGQIGRITEFNHGGCVGVDIEAAEMVAGYRQDGWAEVRVICHPGKGNGDLEAKDTASDQTLPAQSNFARNRAMVDRLARADLLVVVPKQMERQDSGGTWYTYDYAKKTGKRMFVIWPNGSMEHMRG